MHWRGISLFLNNCHHCNEEVLCFPKVKDKGFAQSSFEEITDTQTWIGSTLFLAHLKVNNFMGLEFYPPRCLIETAHIRKNKGTSNSSRHSYSWPNIFPNSVHDVVTALSPHCFEVLPRFIYIFDLYPVFLLGLGIKVVCNQIKMGGGCFTGKNRLKTGKK